MTGPADALALALADLEPELAATRRVLERVPEDRLDWRPHAKSWTLAELATHITNLPMWQQMTLATDELDVEKMPPPPPAATSRDELLARFDAHVAGLRKELPRTTLESLGEPWTFRQGATTVFSQPRGTVLRMFGTSHMIHHRAQLCVYLRLLDAPVPAIYGPSADEAPPR